MRASQLDRAIDRFPTQKTAALLAVLAFYPHRRHTREEVADILWPDADLPAARDRLSQALVWLRRQLEPKGSEPGSVLVTDRASIGLNPAAVTTDVAEFEALLLPKSGGATLESRDRLEQAAALYRGDLLPGFYQDWVLTERHRLLQAYLGALHRLAFLYEEDQDFEPALRYARLALAADPLREEAHTDLIRILAASGETSAALREFRNLERVLSEELGSEPSPSSRALVEAIQQTPPPAPSPREKRNAAATGLPLPVPLTRFFGRDAEIERLCALLQPTRSRLITLIGTGGAGKTRLSLAVSALLRDAYKGAVAFVALADLEEVKVIPAAIAAALNLPESAVTTTAASLTPIVEALSLRPTLLVLDNLEHVLSDAAPLVRELLLRAPTLSILATSRQRLGIEGEQEIPVSSLPLPELTASPDRLLESASIQLFVDRARLARSDFALTESNAADVARVCARLDGIPLAIELCAAWAQMLTPSQMLEKLDRRFDLLVSRRTDITPRHRTLRAALEYSYLQLPIHLQRLFARLSVFRGGWTLPAAVTVASESPAIDSLTMLGELTELRERSLIVAEEATLAGGSAEMRYRILETLREFAGEQLTYADRVLRRRAHADYFVHLAELGDKSVAFLEPEQENLRSALAWSLESQETETGLRLGGALRRYWSVRGRLAEGYDWLRRLFDLAPDESASTVSAEVRAKAWNTLGYLAWAQGSYATALEAHRKALGLFRDTGNPAGIGETLYHLGITKYRQDDYPAAQAFFDESLALAREASDTAGIARVLLNLGNIAYEQTRYDEADAFFRQSLDLEQSLGNQQRVANALNNRGLIAMARKDLETAGGLFQQALTLSRELGDAFSSASFMMNLGTVSRLQNKREHAWSLLSEGLKQAYDIGNKHILSHYLLQLGLLFANSGKGKTQRGVFLLAAAQQVIDAVADSRNVPHPEELEQAMEAASLALGSARFSELIDRARATALAQLVPQILSWDFASNEESTFGKK